MADFLVALGLVFVIEGLIFAADGLLRVVGIASAVLGVLLVWFVRG